MYQPGGATLAFAGPVIRMPSPCWVKLSGTSRWSMSRLCVTAPMWTRFTFEIRDAWGRT